MNKSPNILFIITDQQTYSAMSCAGNPWLHTPHIDRLREEGASFTRSYCAAPVCGPSRMSIVTGLPTHEHGFTHHFSEPWDWAARGLTSFGTHLKLAGYDTRWLGKWHATEFLPKSVDGTSGFHNVVIDDIGREYLGMDTDSVWADEAAKFIGEREVERPFFLGLSLQNPHDICYWIMQVHRDVVDGFSPPPGAELPPLPPNFHIPDDEPGVMSVRRKVSQYGQELKWAQHWNEEDWRRYLYAYYRCVERVDRDIGRVLDRLEAAGLAENTLVIFTSDHGESCAAHELVVKLTVYEEAMRVPLLMRCPSVIEAGAEFDFPVNGLDLAPTILDFANACPLPSARGESLKPALCGQAVRPARAVVSELYPSMDQLDVQARVLWDGACKYILSWDGRFDEAFYDLSLDPGETHNTACTGVDPDKLNACRSALIDWMHATNDPLLKQPIPRDIIKQ